jgi:hypothetical protein
MLSKIYYGKVAASEKIVSKSLVGLLGFVKQMQPQKSNQSDS